MTRSWSIRRIRNRLDRDGRWRVPVLLIGLGLLAVSVYGQAWSELQLRYELWQTAARARQRAEKLFEEGLMATSELEKARVDEVTAEMNFRILLEKWCHNPLLRLADAELHATDGVDRWVLRLRWVNETPQPDSGAVAQELWKHCMAIRASAVVRITDKSGTVIGFPPEQTLPLWDRSRSQTMEFVLLRPLTTVYVYRRTMETERREAVSVRVRAGAYRIEALSPAQVAALGSEIRYTLTVRSLVHGVGPCVLGHEGLPDAIFSQFYDPAAESVVTAVEPTQENASRSIQLRLILPETWPNVRLDRPIEFRVGCRQGNGLVPAVRLELTPTGRPRLEVSLENLFGQTRVGEQAVFHVILRNTGQRRARGVRVETEGPARWGVQWEPGMPWDVLPQQQQALTLALRVPEDATPGEYTYRLRFVVPQSPGTERLDPVELRVRVLGRSGFLPLVLVVVVVGLFVMAGWGLVRLMRRY